MEHLKDIATIRSGHLFRGKIEPDAGGQYQVVQIGNIAPDARLSNGALTRISLPDVKPSQLLEKGDVLFISRGLRKQAVAITRPIENAIAISQFFVLRADKKVLPEYLAWYINQRPAQRYIEEHSTGTSVSLINMEALKLLPIRVLPLASQRRIIKIHQLGLREKELVEAIQDCRRAVIELTLLKAIETRGTTTQ